MIMQIVATATPVTIELPTAVSVAVWTIAVLFAVIVWFLRREIRNNDEAHKELRADVKKLLAGDVAWVRSLLERLPR